MALLGEMLTDDIQQFHTIIQFSWKRTGTDTCGIGFGNPQNIIEITRAHATTGSRTTRGSVGRRHKRIGTVVNIEQGTLRAFKHDVIAGQLMLIQQFSHVGHQRFQFIPHCQGLVQHLIEIHRLRLEVMLEGKIMIIQYLAQLGGKALTME